MQNRVQFLLFPGQTKTLAHELRVRVGAKFGEPAALRLQRCRTDAIVSRMAGDSDSDFISSIEPDVMTCLPRGQFFERLEDVFCPKDDSTQRQVCPTDYRLAKGLLESVGFVNTLQPTGKCFS